MEFEHLEWLVFKTGSQFVVLNPVIVHYLPELKHPCSVSPKCLFLFDLTCFFLALYV